MPNDTSNKLDSLDVLVFRDVFTDGKGNCIYLTKQ